jgi:hypothetical protein
LRRHLRALALIAAAAAPPPSEAQVSRGPIEARDEFLLSQSSLSLAPLPARVLEAKRTELRLDGDWGNDFGIEAEPGGRLEDVLYFVDGEHRTASLTLRRGLGRGFSAGVRIPVHWRGGGWLDSVIDPFHSLFGLPDSGRPLYERNRLRVVGRTPEGVPLAWTGESGAGLGSLEAEVVKSLRGGARGGPALAAAVRLQVPVGGMYGDASGVGLQLLAAQPLGAAFDLHGGFGIAALGPSSRDGIDYEPRRAQGFLAFEWRPVPAWSAIVQWEANGRLATGIERFPGFQLSLRLGSKVDLGPRWRVEGGFVEGIKSLENTIDFGVFVAVQRRF